jgi:hypothetical protein
MRPDAPRHALALLQAICALIADDRARWLPVDGDGLQLQLAGGERLRLDAAGVTRLSSVAEWTDSPPGPAFRCPDEVGMSTCGGVTRSGATRTRRAVRADPRSDRGQALSREREKPRC